MTTGKMYEKIGVKLSDAQLLQLGKELALKQKERLAVEEEKSEALNKFNARLKTLEAEETDIATKINTREDARDIEVREEPDDGRNLILIVAADDGRVLKTRPMTLNEMAEKNIRQNGGAVSQDAEASEDDDHGSSGKRKGGRAKKPTSAEAEAE